MMSEGIKEYGSCTLDPMLDCPKRTESGSCGVEQAGCSFRVVKGQQASSSTPFVRKDRWYEKYYKNFL